MYTYASRSDKYVDDLRLHGCRSISLSEQIWHVCVWSFTRSKLCRRGPLAFDDLFASIIRAPNVIVIMATVLHKTRALQQAKQCFLQAKHWAQSLTFRYNNIIISILRNQFKQFSILLYYVVNGPESGCNVIRRSFLSSIRKYKII